MPILGQASKMPGQENKHFVQNRGFLKKRTGNTQDNLTFIKNEQSYHFSSYANTSISLILTACLLIVCSYIPVSQCPEKTFLRLVRRFFKHSKFLLANTAAGSRKEPCFRNRIKTKFYINDLLALPVQIAAWGARIDHKSFPDNSPEQVQDLVTTLQELALRTRAVLDAREYVHTGHLLMELQNDLHTWWALLESEFKLRITNPGISTLPGIAIPEQLEKRLSLLEKRRKNVFALEDTGNRHAMDYENVYRLLGSYRGLLNSEKKYMLLASKIDWQHWQEGRFEIVEKNFISPPFVPLSGGCVFFLKLVIIIWLRISVLQNIFLFFCNYSGGSW